MALTGEEKVAGRRFRVTAQAVLAELSAANPPTYPVPVVLGVLRHACPSRGGISTALVLREVYIPSPAYDANVPAGRFAWIYREGRCAGCGQTARSEGRLVDGWERAPIHGRVARS